MRINKYVALATGMSRRAADAVIERGRVQVNGKSPESGQDITDTDAVTLDGRSITPPVNTTTIIFNKPTGYVVSRDGQGSQTIYDLLPQEYRSLKPVGRLDKYSSGLLLLTNDGNLANNLTHPSHQKRKIYEVSFLVPLQPLHHQMISDYGVQLEDGLSKFQIERLTEDNKQWRVIMSEGRNRQIRRTFAALGYTVNKLHRVQFGEFSLEGIKKGEWREVKQQ
jgi:23S rRNA pseudouridine2605 synthase